MSFVILDEITKTYKMGEVETMRLTISAFR